MISVVIPVYNVEKYLRQCLDSVINQTYSDLEILIVDDGSTDNSGAICDGYLTDSRVKVFHTDNHGLSSARNYALNRIQGDYIAFLDSDDWLEQNALEYLISTAKRTNADIVVCEFYQEYVGKTIGPKRTCGEFVAEQTAILDAMIVERKLTEDAWNKLYRVELFSDIRYPDNRVFEDKATTYKLLQKASLLAYTPLPLIHYRNRNNSISNNHSLKSLVDYWEVYKGRFTELGIISERYHEIALSECIGAISRMWRWYAGCTETEKQEAQKTLDEMQQFLKEHHGDIKNGEFSTHVKATCFYAKSRSPVVFKILSSMNSLYRRKNHVIFFEQ